MKRILPIAAQSLPRDITIKPLFDQSLFVRASINGVLKEAVIAAALTAVMILLFLGDWRPTIVISISIPLSIFVSVLLLSALGETINIMTLGGLALAVGILVDDATVEIENIERNLAQGKEMKQAILDGASQIAVPAFVSTLCICIVFVPMFFLTGVARYLFVPLAEAVVFAMLASYFLSRTLIPTLVMYIMRGHEHRADAPKTVFGRYQRGFERSFDRFRAGYYQLLETTLEHRKVFAACFLAFCVLSLGLVFFLGEDFFPTVDAGLMRLHMRARPGLRVEETARLADEVEGYLRQQIPKDELVTILDNIGLPYSGINLSYSNSGVVGTSDAEILVGLNAEHHHSTEGYIRKLREDLPRQFPGVEFFFQPADIVTQILNFGLPAPIDIQVTGADMQGNYVIAQQIANRLRHVNGAADVHVQQLLSLPTLHLQIDRTKTTQVGMNARDVAQTVLIALSGSFQTAPNFWLNPKNGVTYQVAVQSPQYRITSLQDLVNMPVNDPGVQSSQVLGNLVQLTPVARPVVVSHYNVQPVIDVYASTQGRDLGAVAKDTMKGAAAFRAASAARHPHHRSRASGDHAVVVHRPGHRTADGDLAGVLPDRGELSVLARSVHHHHRTSGSAGRHLLDPAADPYHAERAVADRRGNVHGRGHGQLHPAGFVCARAHERWHTCGASRAGSGLHSNSSGADDGPGDDHRHGADVAGSGRRRRTERAAGTRRDRRSVVRHGGNPVFCTIHLCHDSRPSRGKAGERSN